MADTEKGHSAETRWVSYGELARIQGISKAVPRIAALHRAGDRYAEAPQSLTRGDKPS